MSLANQYINTLDGSTNLTIKGPSSSGSGNIIIGDAAATGTVDITTAGAMTLTSGDPFVVDADGGTLFDGQTSGTVAISPNAGRTGTITIGNASSSGDISVLAGSGDLVLGGAVLQLPSTVRASDTTTAFSLLSTTTGDINIGTSGVRTGDVTIGDVFSSGDVTLQAGSGNVQLFGSEVRLANSVRAQINGASLNLFTASTNDINIATSGIRTGTLTIGDGSSSGLILINAGSGNLQLRGDQIFLSNYTRAQTSANPFDFLATSTGRISIGGSGVRDGPITIGNDAASGEIIAESGSGDLSLRTSGGLFLGANSPSPSSINIGNHPSRTGTINIGDALASGDIRVHSGGGDTTINASGDIEVGVAITPGAINIGASTWNYLRTVTTFTPTIGGTSGSDFTTSVATGRIINHGGIYHVTARVTWTSRGTAAGTLRLKNMPAYAEDDPGSTFGLALFNNNGLDASNKDSDAYMVDLGGSQVIQFLNDGAAIDVSDTNATGTLRMGGFMFRP
jgi:hypothetical protein